MTMKIFAIERKELNGSAPTSDSAYKVEPGKSYEVIAQLDHDVDGFNLILRAENGEPFMAMSVDFEFESGPAKFSFNVGYFVEVVSHSITAVKEFADELTEKLEPGSEYSKHISQFIFEVDYHYQQNKGLNPDDYVKINKHEPVINWAFVEEHLPGYGQSVEVALNEDLCKLVNNEYEEGDDAHKLLLNQYNGDIKNTQIKIDYDKSLLRLYVKAIEGLLKKKQQLI